jgi:hypothetical protein
MAFTVFGNFLDALRLLSSCLAYFLMIQLFPVFQEKHRVTTVDPASTSIQNMFPLHKTKSFLHIISDTSNAYLTRKYDKMCNYDGSVSLAVV